MKLKDYTVQKLLNIIKKYSNKIQGHSRKQNIFLTRITRKIIELDDEEIKRKLLINVYILFEIYIQLINLMARLKNTDKVDLKVKIYKFTIDSKLNAKLMIEIYSIINPIAFRKFSLYIDKNGNVYINGRNKLEAREFYELEENEIKNKIFEYLKDTFSDRLIHFYNITKKLYYADKGLIISFDVGNIKPFTYLIYDIENNKQYNFQYNLIKYIFLENTVLANITEIITNLKDPKERFEFLKQVSKNILFKAKNISTNQHTSVFRLFKKTYNTTKEIIEKFISKYDKEDIYFIVPHYYYKEEVVQTVNYIKNLSQNKLKGILSAKMFKKFYTFTQTLFNSVLVNRLTKELKIVDRIVHINELTLSSMNMNKDLLVFGRRITVEEYIDFVYKKLCFDDESYTIENADVLSNIIMVSLSNRKFNEYIRKKVDDIVDKKYKEEDYVINAICGEVYCNSL